MRPASDASEHHSRVVTSSFVHERPNMAIWQLLWQPQRCHNITLGARPMGYFEELTYHTLLSPFDLVSSDLIWSRNFGLVIVRLGLLRLNVWVCEWEWSMDRGYVAPVRTRWGSRLGRVDGGFILRVGRLTCIPTDLFFFFFRFPFRASCSPWERFVWRPPSSWDLEGAFVYFSQILVYWFVVWFFEGLGLFRIPCSG